MPVHASTDDSPDYIILKDPLGKNDERECLKSWELTMLLEKPNFCYALKSSTKIIKKSLYLGCITGIAYCVWNYRSLMDTLKL